MILKNKVSLRISNVSARLLRCAGSVKLHLLGGLKSFHRNDFTCDLRAA